MLICEAIFRLCGLHMAPFFGLPLLQQQIKETNFLQPSFNEGEGVQILLVIRREVEANPSRKKRNCVPSTDLIPQTRI